MDNKDDLEVFTGGIDKKHRTWLTLENNVLSYDEYIELIYSLVEDMNDDLRRINKNEFKSDMQDITRIITRESKTHRQKLTPNDIDTPELKMKELSSGKKLDIAVNLSELKGAHIFNDHILVITKNYFLSLIPRDTYQAMTGMLAPLQVKHFIEKGHIQYILYNYRKTVASMEKIINYASKHNMLVNDLKDGRFEDVLNFSNFKDNNKDNILKFSHKN
ncbi:hypothetical protein [Companilactobacillus zhachilii]|uniref:hypothetical protein n=1 Tax=Companilactobacillus zhachilii TaxID=2304606 RepID=UPI004034B85A